jgi:pyrroline-5-carboxylate reductase
MAEAMISRLVSLGHYPASEILVSDPVPERRDFLHQAYGVITTDDNTELEGVNTLLLAIKPQILPVVAQQWESLSPAPGQLVLSILAGVPLSKLEAAFPQRGVVRAMPNTPATVGQAMTALALGQRVTPEQGEIALALFSAIGEVVIVPETLMDAVTGLSGSGPAYVALVIEALADGGVAVGLPRPIAQQLALQTVRGTAALLHETQRHPALLKDQVCSPGGTTIAGVMVLESNGFRGSLMAAVKAATQRAKELGQM